MSFLDNDGLSYLWNKIKTIFMTRSQVDSLLASNYYVKTQASISSSSDISINNAAQYKALDTIIDIEPVQAGSGDASPTNVRPITGWTGAQITRKGKNLLGPIGNGSRTHGGVTFTINADGSITLSGTATSNISYWLNPTNVNTQYRYQLIGKRRYTLSGCPVGGSTSTFRIVGYPDLDSTYVGTALSDIGSGSSANTSNISFDSIRVMIDIKNGTVCNGLIFRPQLELDSTATSYESYQGETYNITFPTEAGTVCSGTLDATNGKLTVKSVLWTKNTSTMDNGEAYPGWRNAGVAAILGTGLNSIITTIANIGTKIGINTSTANSGDVLFLNPNDYSGKTETEWKALAMDVQVVLPLPTPVTYNLTPQDITLLRGTNYILANCGDISLRYFLLGIEDIISEVSTSSIPTGGTSGQALIKNSGANYDLAWGNMLPKDISTLTSLPQAPSSGDLLAVRSGNDTYKIDYNALASAILTNTGDGSFESLTTNSYAGSGTVKIQRYGKTRFLFVDFRPSSAGTNTLIAQVDSSDAPDEDIVFACTGYSYPGQSELVLQTDGSLILNVYGTPNNSLKGTVAYMVP